jgi:hypothetical protein
MKGKHNKRNNYKTNQINKINNKKNKNKQKNKKNNRKNKNKINKKISQNKIQTITHLLILKVVNKFKKYYYKIFNFNKKMNYSNYKKENALCVSHNSHNIT